MVANNHRRFAGPVCFVICKAICSPECTLYLSARSFFNAETLTDCISLGKMSPSVTVALSIVGMTVFLLLAFALHPAAPAPAGPSSLPPPPTTTTTTTTTATPSSPTTLLNTPSAVDTLSPGSSVAMCPESFSPINTSSAWLNSEGPWAYPCHPASAVRGAQGLQNASGAAGNAPSLRPVRSSEASVSRLTREVEVMCREAVDAVNVLQRKIVENNMDNAIHQAQRYNSLTILPEPRNFTAQFTDKLQFVTALRRQIRVALVYLEQNRYNELPLCVRESNLVNYYDLLDTTLLQVLCKTEGIITALNSDPTSASTSTSQSETVLRSVMPANLRAIRDVVQNDVVYPGDDIRNYRDYVVAGDVRTILLSAAGLFREMDRSLVTRNSE